MDWKGYNPNLSVLRNPQWMQWYSRKQNLQASWFQGIAFAFIG